MNRPLEAGERPRSGFLPLREGIRSIVMRVSLLLLVLVLVAVPRAESALAAEPPPAAGGGTNARLDLSGIGLPILRDGKIVNFVFIRARVELVPGLTPAEIEAREPFIRAGLVRTAYRTPLNASNDLMAVDRKRFEAALLKEAKAAFGASQVRSVLLRDQKAQKRVFLPPEPRSPGGAAGRP